MHSQSLTLLTSIVSAGLLFSASSMAQEVAETAPAETTAPMDATEAPMDATEAPMDATDASTDATEAPTDAAAPTEAVVEDEGGVGLNLDLEIGSAYVWRGLNAWGPKQRSQHLSVFPSATVSVDSLWFGYWGAYQLTGNNKSANVDVGLGAEQDVYAGYDLSLTDELGMSLFGTFYFYPVADSPKPLYLEPGVSVSYSTVVDIGLGVMYFRGLNDVSDLYSHLYLNPTVSKELELTADLSLSVGAGFGYKVWTNGDHGTSGGNNFDVLGDVGLTYAIDAFYLSPAVHAAYTDVPEGADAGDGLAYWGGVNLGYDFSF